MDKKLIIVSGISVLLIGGAYFFGTTQAKANLNDTIVTIKTAEEKQSALQQDITKAEKTLEDLRIDSDSKRTELAEAKQLIDQKDSLTKKVSTLSTDIDSKKNEVDVLAKDIEGKNKEIEKLEKGIVTLKAEPRDLPAGDFKVGSDIDAGRYKVTPNGGSSGNFFVNDGMDANVILGNDSFSVKEYVVTLSDGDKITQSLPVTFQLISE